MGYYEDNPAPWNGQGIIKKVIIKNGVTSIGGYAFAGRSSITSVSIPKSVKYIDREAFRSCTGLTSITIPNSVTSIGNGAFYRCTGLTSIIIPNSITYIGSGVFQGCTGLTSVTIPNSVRTIDYNTYYDDYLGGAFQDCTGLTSISLPNSIKTIGSYAFKGCTGLSSVSIPNSVETIHGAAFSGCTGLFSITIPSNVTNISSNPFTYCTNLTSINVDSENQYYDSRNNCNAIICKSDNTLVCGCENTIIQNSVTGIGSCAFEGCEGLTSITIPNNVTSIGDGAFENCDRLTSITIPNSVTSIGNSAFYDCESLISITISNSVTHIGWDAFLNCTALTSITIPNSVTHIGWDAFLNCTALKTVTINVNKNLKIDDGCFYGCKPENFILSGETLPANTEALCSSIWEEDTDDRMYSYTTLFVPISLYEKYKSSYPWRNFSKIRKWVDSPAYLSDGEIYINELKSDNAKVSYTRTFNNTSWQALYIPFSMSYDDWKEDFEVAHINSIHQYDKDDDGIIDETSMEVVKIKNGSLIPNTPYLIRAKTTGEKTITVTNSTLCKSEENSIECSTMLAKYTFTGTYNPISASTLIENNYYAMGGGSLIMTDGSNGLKPFRWYMKIDARSPMYNVSNGAKTITINVVGEEETTGITNSQHLSPNDQIYDLNGRRVNQNNLKPGIYVKNGKKIIIK